MDFTDKETLRKFIKDNDIQDIVQLNMFIKKMMDSNLMSNSRYIH